MRKVKAQSVNGVMTPVDPTFWPPQGPTVLHKESWYDAPYYFEYPPETSDGSQTRHYGLASGLNSAVNGWVYPELLNLWSGMLTYHTWRVLEPAKGSYDFSRIVSNLNWVQTNRPNARLIVRFLSQSFQTTGVDFLSDTSRNLPDWCYGDPDVKYYASANGGIQKGWAECIWDSATLTRIGQLVSAMGAAFGSHPNFEGFMLMESAGSLNTTLFPPPVAYTDTAKVAALKQLVGYAKAAFPGKAIIAAINYLEPTTGISQQPAWNWADWCASNGVEVCWEDTCPFISNYHWPMAAIAPAWGRTRANAIVAYTNYNLVAPNDQPAAIQKIKRFGCGVGVTRMLWNVTNDVTWANLKAGV